ncbi:MAG: DUF4438 domain-containing protein [Cyanobacteria bacterium J06639_16]
MKAQLNHSNKYRLQTNHRDLVQSVVVGQIANPIGRSSPYRIGNDGVARVLPGGGGIALNQRIGDRCVGIAGDHVEPGVALHNNDREVVGGRKGPNLALITYACVGNRAVVIDGPCMGQTGIVTGKHGGVDHVMVDFPPKILKQLRIRDRIQIYSHGAGLQLTNHPAITVTNCSPSLLKRWGIRATSEALQVPVTHKIPAGLMGSGLGKNTVWRGDVDIQLFDPAIRRRFKLESLRYGDLVAIIESDSRFGPSVKKGRTTVGVIVHSDSSVSGHGPGVTPLLTGTAKQLQLVVNPQANLAVIFSLRMLPPAKGHRPITSRRNSQRQVCQPDVDSSLEALSIYTEG